jgi:transcription termination factor Rho
MAKGQRVALHAPVGTDVIRFFTNVAVTCKRGIQPIALLIGEAPEDVGRFLSEAPDTEVFSTTFDQTEEEHIRAIKMASARAMRMAEDGKDVILFVDSLTDAAKLFENEGNKLSCGLSSEGVQECKKIFALARDLKRLGSITLFGVIREGESAADRYIAEEFDRLANCHIVFSRELSAQYICPPIDLTKSYTEREYSLLSQKFLSVICGLRAKAAKEGSAGVLTDLDKASGEKAFLDQMSKYQA